MVHVVWEQPATTTKPAKVCICLDPSQTVNKAILRQVYPIPTLEENLHCFYQVKIFSTFDIKDAFQTNNLTEESSLLTTVHTPWGQYRWTRLPFGTSSAPEEFQHRIHDVLCGLECVVNIADDIIMVGRDKTLSEATHDHDRTVIELMDCLIVHGLRLDPDKIKFKICTAPFISVNGQKLNVVEKFTYLGSTFSCTVVIEDEVNTRLAKADATPLADSTRMCGQTRHHHRDKDQGLQSRSAHNTAVWL